MYTSLLAQTQDVSSLEMVVNKYIAALHKLVNVSFFVVNEFYLPYVISALRKALVKTIPHHYSTAVNGNLVGLDFPNFVSLVKTLRELLLLHRHQRESGGVGLPQFRFSR